MKTLFTTLLLSFFPLLAFSDTLTIFFDFDQYALTPPETLKINQFKQQLSAITIDKIEAHTDRSGSHQYNRKLSQQRLTTVINKLELPLKNNQHYPLGETAAEEAAHYIAEDFRKVDIIFSPIVPEIQETPPPPVVEEPIIEPHLTEAQLSAKELASAFTNFINDSTQQTATHSLAVHFIPGSDGFLDPNDPELWSLFDIMNYNSSVQIHLKGHVCCGPSKSLSSARAYAVYNFLTKRGISPKRIEYSGHSNTEPRVSPELTEEDRMKNRRVDVLFKKSF